MTPVNVDLNIQQDDSGTDVYSKIGSAQVANAWTEIKGHFGLRITGTLVSLKLYISGAPSGVEIFADDVTFGRIVADAPENVLINPSLDSNLDGWVPMAGSTIARSQASHTGMGCVEATRTAAYQGVAQNMFGRMLVGQTYFISGWARTDSTVTESVKLTVKRDEGANPYFTNVATEQVPSGCWVWLSGYYTPQPLTQMTNLVFYVEGPPAGVKLYFDDAYIAPVTGLRKAAANFPGMRLGSVMGTDRWSSSVKFANAHAGNFHMASTENDTKFAGIQSQQDVFNYTKSNATLDFSQVHGGASRGHCFVWHGDSVPSWVTGAFRTPAEMQGILWNHIDTAATYFRNRLPFWDVVNEAINGDGTLRTTTTSGAGPTYWYDSPGIGYAADGRKYISESFKRARASDPDAKLFYNDFATNYVNNKSTGVYNLLVSLLADGTPVDGVGIQSHFNGNTVFNVASSYTNLLRFQNLGVDIHMTEVDNGIPVDANGFASATDLENQGTLYFDLLGSSLAFSRMKLFQVWGLYDGASWIPGQSGYTRGQPLPFDFNFDKKPAFWGMWNALSGQAEKFAVLALSSGDTSTTVADSSLNAGAGRRLNANSGSDYITYKVEVPFKGQWNIKAGMLKNAMSGRFQLAVAPPGSSDFADVGTVQDTYAAASAAVVFNLGTTDFPTAGDWQFRFTVPSKNTASAGFSITLDHIRLSPISCEPKFTMPLADQAIAAGTELAPTLFIAEDDTAGGSLVVTATSSNPSLVPDANLVIGGAAPYFTLAATPLGNQNGETVITVTASDGVRSTIQTFTLTVGTGNSPPAFTSIANITTDEDSAPSPVLFAVSDENSPGDSLLVAASSSNATLIPQANLTIGGVPWSGTDIGAVAAAGSGTVGDSATLQASGADFYGVADEGYFNYQPMSGDGEMTARVTSLQNTNVWAKAGVMMRASTSAGSANAYMHVSANQGVEFTRRLSDGITTTNNIIPGVAAPCWVRLVKTGNNFTGYYATDTNGVRGPWIQVGTAATIPTMGISLLRGLAATSHHDGIVGISTYDQISGPPNRSLSITPAGNQSGVAAITVSASDGTAASSSSFTITVNPVNDAPVITSPTNQQIFTGNSINPLGFTVGDLDTIPALLEVTATSSNETLIPPSGMIITGSTTDRYVEIHPATGQLGSSTITLTVNDGGLSAQSAFHVTVTGTGLETWRFQHYGTAENAGDAEDTFDLNKDGENNFLEFATGQTPAAATIVRPLFSNGPEMIEFTYPRGEAAVGDGFTFAIESSVTLAPGSWSPVDPGWETVTGIGAARTVTIGIPRGPEKRRFLRLHISKP